MTIETQLGNGVTVASSYDAAGRRIADDCNLPNGYSFLLEQLWDAAGNRTLAIERSTGNTEGWWHWYDSTNRLLGSLSLQNPRPVATNPLAPPRSPRPLATFRCQRVIDNIISGYRMNLRAQPEYSYDSAGNRTSERTGIVMVPYRSNVRNEHLSAGSASFLYDRAGRLVNDTQFTFFYNFRGQLIQAATQVDGKVVLQIFHDATGRQVGVIEGARTRVFALDGATPIESYDNGVLSAVYMWENLDRLCFFASDGTDQYVLRDVLESTRLTSDAHAAAISVFRYDAFGKLLAGAPASPILYSGKYLYEAIGWYEYRSRQYIPALGRFAQPDPAGFVDGANLYTYVGNNPLSASDPSGTDRKTVVRSAREYEFEPTVIEGSHEGTLRATFAAALLEETPAVNTEDEGVSTGSVPPVPTDQTLANQIIRHWASSESPPSFLRKEIGVTDMSPEHKRRVAYTVNWAILEARDTLVNLNNRNFNQYDVLALARGIVTGLREGLRWELPDGTESIILRDAERFLWGRIGAPFLARKGILGLRFPESILDTFAEGTGDFYEIINLTT